MKRGGGFVPSEARSPRPLTQPYACTLAGAQTSSHRAHFATELEKRRGARTEVFSSPSWGGTPHFSWKDRGSSEKRRARGVHAGTRERAGVPDLVRHEAASLRLKDSSPSSKSTAPECLRVWRRPAN